MKYLIIYVAILLATLQSHAQNDLVRYRPCNAGCTSSTTINDPIDSQFGYGDTTIFETRDVVSDYGIRNVSKGSRFHKGIDYSTEQNNNDKGNAIVALKAGTVSSIGGKNGYKYITVGNYRYGHIFMNANPIGKNYQKVGKFILKQVEKIHKSTNDEIPWTIIDLEYCRAFCAESGRTVTVDDLPITFCGGKTFTTINYVEEGWDIAPMGNSGGNFETHLHLERRENVTMNLDKADILLQRDGSNDYEHIVGFEGSKKVKIESRFWLGANHNTTIYPSNWNARDFGSWTQTGTYPYAHNDANNQIYDDCFFADFYTRIHKDKHDVFIDVPANARYNDGKYKLKPTVTNVRDELFTIPSIDLTLDNFLPYLTEVNIKYNADPLHQTLRVGDEGSAKADDGYITNQIHEYPIGSGLTLPNTLTIEIKTSEPMQNVKMAYVKEPFYT